MNKLLALCVTAILVIALITSTSHAFAITSSEAKKKITDAIAKEVEGDWSKLKLVIIRESGQSRVTIWNTTKPIPIPPVICPQGQHVENGICVPDTTPTSVTKVALVGDISGITVRDAIKKRNPDLVIGLGDLTYSSTLSSFKDNYGNTFGAKLRCVIGNHDSTEDGSSAIYIEAKQYCHEVWYVKLQGGAIFIGFNSNGDLSTNGNQFNYIKGLLTNTTLMNGVKTVHIDSHKPCFKNPPNMHHNIESNVKTFCSNILSVMSSSVTVYFENGHNHVVAKSANGLWYTSGGGGRSHYSCGTNSEWPFCNNQKYGFLELTIDKTSGATVGTFYDTGGNKLN